MGAVLSTLDLPDYDPHDYRDETELNLDSITYPSLGKYTSDEPSIHELVRMTQEEHMELSDAITRRYALNPLFLEIQKKVHLNHEHELDLLSKEMFRKLAKHGTIVHDGTDIGNIAFVAFHNPEGFFQNVYEARMDRIRDACEATLEVLQERWAKEKPW